MIVVSFDIDGTLEVGDPPGPILLRTVARARELGHVVGSASDRVRSDQQQIWDAAELAVDFVTHKHHLTALRERYPATRFVHIGDSQADEYYAHQAGFEFYLPDAVPADGTAGWIL